MNERTDSCACRTRGASSGSQAGKQERKGEEKEGGEQEGKPKPSFSAARRRLAS